VGEQKRTIIGFRPERLAGALAQRGGSTSLVAKRDLERYYQAVDDEISGLRLAQGELEVLWALLERMQFRVTPDSYRYAEAHLGEVLVWPGVRVRRLIREGSPMQLLALLDYAERTYQFRQRGEELHGQPYLSLPPVRSDGVPEGTAQVGPDPRGDSI
jgi:hypothetical protein